MPKIYLAALFFVVSSGSLFATKVGVINMPKIMAEIKEGKKINQELKKKFDKWDSELKKEASSLQKEKEKMQKQAPLWSAKVKQEKMMGLGQKELALRRKATTYEQQIRVEEQKKKAPILKKLRTIIDKVSKSAKVDLTVEMSTTPVLYAKDKVDLSAQVIKMYDSTK